jgi:hypothetical protein
MPIKKQGMAPPPQASGKGGDVDKGKVVQQIGVIHNNLAGLLRGKKFSDNFLLNYSKINQIIKKQLRIGQKDEKTTKEYLDETKKNVGRLKDNQSNPIVSVLIGLMSNVLFFSVGSIFLISFARSAFETWKKEYVPETNEEDGKIFGIHIPGLASIKAYAIGIYNFMRVGLPKYYHTFMGFFKGIYEELFGKKGCIRNLD